MTFQRYSTNRIDAGGGSVIVNADGTITVTGAVTLGAVTLGALTGTGAATNSSSTALTNAAEGNTGALTRHTTRQVVSMGTGATAVSTSISVPSGARLLAVALNVNVAITNDGDDTWAAAFSTGSTTAIASAGTAATQNTKVSLVLADDEVTSGVTEITFTPQGANFTAGSIEAIVWYEQITALANA